jgi:hypothetical protein
MRRHQQRRRTMDGGKSLLLVSHIGSIPSHAHLGCYSSQSTFAQFSEWLVQKSASKEENQAILGSIGIRRIYWSHNCEESYTAGDDLHIISHPQEMFDDMISNQLTRNGKDAKILLPLLKKLHERPLRVATMCSGTESPVLALDMLSNAIEDFLHTHANDEEFKGLETMQIEHVFSCEIEPFKQAYIERNFQPPLLFRDIRELGKTQAATAYGSLANVPNTPGCVDILIAGTSCVDYSSLNNDKKTMDQKGESGQTFRGMIEWIIKAETPIVIIENVRGAPWDKKVKVFQDLGYDASFVIVDTKKYYIPHTRMRGYLFAVKRTSSGGGRIASGTVEKWRNLVKKLERPASAALDAFMLPNDDPRVLRGRARLSSGNNGGSSSNAVDWTKCESRHQVRSIHVTKMLTVWYVGL